VVPFDRLGMVSYYCPIVTLSIRRTVFQIFDFKYTKTLKSGSGVTQGHRNWYHSTDWLWFRIETLSVRHTVFEIFTFEKYHDLETGVRGH